MLQRVLIAALVAGACCTNWFANSAEAAARGSIFDVEVQVNRDDEFDDRWVFTEDGDFHANHGNLNGSFNELDLIIFSIFTINADDNDDFEVFYAGFQYADQILAVGVSNENDVHLVTGTREDDDDDDDDDDDNSSTRRRR